MYDSDEVRDAVRRDAQRLYMLRSWALLAGANVPGLTPAEQATLDDALAAGGNPWQEALREYLADVEARQREREEWAARL